MHFKNPITIQENQRLRNNVNIPLYYLKNARRWLNRKPKYVVVYCKKNCFINKDSCVRQRCN